MRHELTIDLPIRNDWGNVELIRTSILNCFTAVFSDLDGCRAVAMVVGELLENAIKYGAWEGSAGGFRLHVTGDDHSATVTVENPVAPGADGKAAGADLVEAVRRLGEFPSAEAAYRTRLLEMASDPSSLGGSRLGLARIAYEGNCKLAASVDGGVAKVTAEVAY